VGVCCCAVSRDCHCLSVTLCLSRPASLTLFTSVTLSLTHCQTQSVRTVPFVSWTPSGSDSHSPSVRVSVTGESRVGPYCLLILVTPEVSQDGVTEDSSVSGRDRNHSMSQSESNRESPKWQSHSQTGAAGRGT
jgi:hypothetical protein